MKVCFILSKYGTTLFHDSTKGICNKMRDTCEREGYGKNWTKIV